MSQYYLLLDLKIKVGHCDLKVTDLEYFIFIAFTLKFGVKSLLSEGGGTGRGYT